MLFPNSHSMTEKEYGDLPVIHYAISSLPELENDLEHWSLQENLAARPPPPTLLHPPAGPHQACLARADRETAVQTVGQQASPGAPPGVEPPTEHNETPVRQSPAKLTVRQQPENGKRYRVPQGGFVVLVHFKNMPGSDRLPKLAWN
jgi:hypothetical protein